MLKRNPQKYYEWKKRSKSLKRTGFKSQCSPKRRVEETAYRKAIGEFLSLHPVCPVTGQSTTQIHHSAKREGKWLNLQRYWIAVSLDGHATIEANKKWAATVGLMVRIADDYSTHVTDLVNQGKSLTEPIFYENYSGEILGKGEPWESF